MMYGIMGVHGSEPRWSGGNTSSNPHISALIPRPALSGMEGMCQCHGSNQNSYPPVLSRKPLSNQFIHYHISRGGVFGINHFKLHSFAVVAIVSFATVGRGSMMTRILYTVRANYINILVSGANVLTYVTNHPKSSD